jgi:probable F420-dependent oxidoreductase
MLRFWVQLPQAGAVAIPRNVRAYALLAEELGFDGVWLGDHIVLPDEYGSRYPYGAAHPVAADRPFLEALTTLAFVAGATRRVRLAVAVLVAPYRPPLLQAKQIATLDDLSEGRLEVGFGAGWLAEEFAALGVDYAQRGSITDEAIGLMQSLWTGESVSHDGRHFSLHGIRCLPRPAQRPGPPLWIGGNSASALRRVLRTGAGWLAPAQTAQELAGLIERLRALGDGSPPRAAASVVVTLAGAPLPTNGGPQRPALELGGSCDVLVELQEAGITDVRLELTTLPARERPGAIARLGRMLEEDGLKAAL